MKKMMTVCLSLALLLALAACQQVTIIDPPSRTEGSALLPEPGSGLSLPDNGAPPAYRPLDVKALYPLGSIGYCMGEKGVYEIEETGEHTGRLLYTDFDAKQQRVLCNKDGCQHRDAGCQGWLDDKHCQLVWLENSLGLVYWGFANPDIVSPPRILRMDPHTLETQVTFQAPENSTCSPRYTDGRFLLTLITQPKTGQGQVPGQEIYTGEATQWTLIDTQTGDVHAMDAFFPEHGILFGTEGSRLLFGDGEEGAASATVYSLDLRDGAAASHEYPGLYNTMGINESNFAGGVYYYSTLRGVESVLSLAAYSLQDESETIIISGLPGEVFYVNRVVDGYLFGVSLSPQNPDGTECCVRLEDGEMRMAGEVSGFEGIPIILEKCGENYLVCMEERSYTYFLSDGSPQHTRRPVYGLVSQTGFWDHPEDIQPIDMLAGWQN